MQPIKTVICDLGNVLVRFDHLRACKGFAQRTGLDPNEIYDKMFRSDLEKDYDLGLVSSQEFAARVNGLFGKDLRIEEIQRIWSEIFWPMEGAASLLQALKKQVSLILLSNTNEWHFSYCQQTYSYLSLMDHFALSYRMGARKPQTAAFQGALDLAGESAGACFFIDDVAEYIEAAACLGVRGVRFQSIDQLSAVLEGLGLETA